MLEALILKGPLGLTEDDIDHMHGLGYSRTDDEALELVLAARYDCAFFLRSSPVEQVRDDRRGRREHAAQVDVLLSRRSPRACCSTRCVTRVAPSKA